MGDALKSQKKGLKMDVTRMGYLRVCIGIHMQKHIVIVRGGNCGLKCSVLVRGGNYLRNAPGG